MVVWEGLVAFVAVAVASFVAVVAAWEEVAAAVVVVVASFAGVVPRESAAASFPVEMAVGAASFVAVLVRGLELGK